MPTRFKRIPDWTSNREELAWAAGFCDGEGSFHVDLKGFKRGKRGKPNPRFEIGQIEPFILERFRAAVGFANPINGPYNNTKNDAKRPAAPAFVYGVSGFENVQMLLILLWPWLGPTKREQALRTLNRVREAYI